MERYYDVEHQNISSRYMTKVYGWMFLGLLLTAFVSLATASSMTLMTMAAQSYWFLFLVELGIVFWLSMRVTRMHPATAVLWFLAFAALNGFVLTPIIAYYTGATIVLAFGITAISFGAMSLYGYITKADLTRIGSLAVLGLIGVLVAMLVNMFLHSSAMQWVISYLGVAIFTILTAWDTQRIKSNAMYQRYAVFGSLTLYLDFINIFLFLLSIFGGGGRRR